MRTAHQDRVAEQFGPRAKAYVESAVHAGGADLDAIEALAARLRPARALDLGSGGGHVAYRLARHSGTVTACDLSAEMLAAVAATARDRGLGNIETVTAPAERLPFEAGVFDALGCRYSAHHWRDFEAGLREARRVLKPGAAAVFVDSFAPANPLLDTHLQAIELLRDTSHARNYSLSEWTFALGRAGFTVCELRSFKVRLDFASWIARMRTPDLLAAAIRALQTGAPSEVQAHFAIEPDGSFLLDVMLIEAAAA